MTRRFRPHRSRSSLLRRRWRPPPLTVRPALVANSALNVVIALVFPTVAVPNPKSASGANDRLNKVLPALYRRGAPGYRIVYQNDTWRLYGRMPNVARQKDY
jgi:hypothetical protein